MSDFNAHRFELLLPWQLWAIIERTPIAYIPLGTIEWHCEHLPVGLDALTAHGLCLRAAERTGGVVLPTLYYGTGGGHGAYPFTIMMPGPEEIEGQIAFTLKRLQDFGFKKAVIFSGHFPNAQYDMIMRLAANATTSSFKVFVADPKRVEGLGLPPDHAGAFETTLLYALHPDLVQLNRLPSLKDAPLTTDDWSETRHDPKHPVYGVFGPDPRGFDPNKATPLLEAATNWLVKKVEAT